MRSAWILVISKLKIVHSQQHVATINYLSGRWRNLRKIRILTRRVMGEGVSVWGGCTHECFTTMSDYRLDQSASLAAEEADSSTPNNKSTVCRGSRMTGTAWHFNMRCVCSPGGISRGICCRLTSVIAVGSARCWTAASEAEFDVCRRAEQYIPPVARIEIRKVHGWVEQWRVCIKRKKTLQARTPRVFDRVIRVVPTLEICFQEANEVPGIAGVKTLACSRVLYRKLHLR